MSSLKRSNSTSNVPRLSRLPVRQSGASKRSSSARPSNINTNLLTAVSGTMGRSSSCTNLVTPSRRIQCPTPSSVMSSVSRESKVHDKDWQKYQFQRVKTFFHGINSEISLKPLTIRTYVYSMDILFKYLDSRISITMENYKESILDYLKSFKYPYNLKPSVIKTPAVPTSWPHILQIWIWLLDIIQDSEKVLLSHVLTKEFPSVTTVSMYYFADRFRAFNSEEEKEEDVDERFLANLSETLNIDMSNIKEKVEENLYLDSQLETLKASVITADLTVQSLSDDVSKIRNANAMKIQERYNKRNQLLDQAKEFAVTSKNLDGIIRQAEDEAEKLIKIISEQTHSKEEVSQMLNKIHEERISEKYKAECQENLARLTEDYDTKINCLKQTFKSTIYKINNEITALSCKAPVLGELKIPEEILYEPNLDCYVNNFNEKMKKLKTDLEMESTNLEAKINSLEQDNKNFTVKLDTIAKKIKEYVDTQNEHEQAFTKKCEVLNKNIHKKRLATAEVEEKRQDLVANRPNVELLQKKLESATKKKAHLTPLADEMLHSGWDLILTVHHNIKKILETQQTIMSNAQPQLDVDFEEFLTALDHAIAEADE